MCGDNCLIMPNDIRTRPAPAQRTTQATQTSAPAKPETTLAEDAAAYVPSDAGKIVGARSIVAVVGSGAAKLVTAADWSGTAADAGKKLLEHPKYGKFAAKVMGRINVSKLSDGFERVTGHAEKVGLVAAGASAAFNSKTHHAVWKAGEGVAVVAASKVFVGGLGELAIQGVKVGNPLVVADLAMNYLGAKVIGETNHRRAGGYISGHVVTIPARLAMAYAEAIVHGDMRALDAFAAEAKAGDLGIVYQTAIETGEKLSGVLNAGIEWTGDLLSRAAKAINGRR